MRALSRNTRRATAITLAAALVIAVYLNWQYARNGVPSELESTAAAAAQAEDVPVQADAILDELPTEAEAVSSANNFSSIIPGMHTMYGNTVCWHCPTATSRTQCFAGQHCCMTLENQLVFIRMQPESGISTDIRQKVQHWQSKFASV